MWNGEGESDYVSSRHRVELVQQRAGLLERSKGNGNKGFKTSECSSMSNSEINVYLNSKKLMQ